MLTVETALGPEGVYVFPLPSGKSLHADGI